MCSQMHTADSSSCSIRAEKSEVIGTMDRFPCSHFEAVSLVKQRSISYSAVTSHKAHLLESAISKMNDAAIEKAVTQLVDPILQTPSMSLTQIVTNTLTEILQSCQPALPALSVEMPLTSFLVMMASLVNRR